MSRANEILKEKFGISTEGKTLEQVLDEMSDKYDTLDKENQKELEKLLVGERLDMKDSSISANVIYEDWNDEKIRERLVNDDSKHYNLDDITYDIPPKEKVVINDSSFVGNIVSWAKTVNGEIPTKGNLLLDLYVCTYVDSEKSKYRLLEKDEMPCASVILEKEDTKRGLIRETGAIDEASGMSVEQKEALEKLIREFKAKDWI